MKQVFQNLSTGETTLVDIPSPQLNQSSILIKSSVSLISPGTERMLVDFAKSGLIAKARSQPEKVRQVLEKVGTDGLLTTVDAVRSKLDQPLPLGYCNVGIVRESNEPGYSVGDRVVSNGPHADIVSVKKNLCALIPDNVSNEAASFTVVASIGLQGIRLAKPTLGETFVVTGVGLIGLLTVQMLLAQGCRVLAIDYDPLKLEIAKSYGAEICNPGKGEDPVAVGIKFSRGQGIDGVIITASTKTSDPVTHAAQMCRKRGRIVLVGVTGLELNRSDFYEKELTFQVSCSYGPGRYDDNFEVKGQDYPLGFVRWTEQRNFTAVLDLLSSGALDVTQLINFKFPFTEAPKAYELLSNDKSLIGVLLTYDHTTESKDNYSVDLNHVTVVANNNPQLSFIGAGNYAGRMLIPAFQKAGANFNKISASSGARPAHLGRKFGFKLATTDVNSVLADTECSAVVIATRHNTHASLVKKAITFKKHVFVEKPLCINQCELDDIQSSYADDRLLMVGFNRRFAPLILDLKSIIDSINCPKAFVYTCNAGSIPENHWTQDPSTGGGRLIGEACHFVDLLRYLAASPIRNLQQFNACDSKPCPDTFSLQLNFEDGSIGTVHYFANGSKSFPKERLEVFADGKIFMLDNFRKLQAWGAPGFRTRRNLAQDKGQIACSAAFLKAIETGGKPPIPVQEIFEVQRWLLKAST